MARPSVYFIRHGETDWNVEGRLQGRRDIAMNARGRQQATQAGLILRDLLEREGRAFTSLRYVSSPLGRATETMRGVREALGLPAAEFQTDTQLLEISFGDWEGFTLAELRGRDPQRAAAREQDKWRFVAPGGESYEAMSARMGRWYEALTDDTVAVAHGGTARGLMAHLGHVPAAAAPLVDIVQGAVYVFSSAGLARYT
ncbi:MAG: histidine phosphatase family protein [Pseudolabrys sp.]|nr:histidine phosphatase family protein [Pseudolabrys sp.]